MNPQDPLQYVKDMTNLSWRDLGYSNQMTNPLGKDQPFYQGADMAGYFEDGGIQGSKLQNISANRIVTSILDAAVDVGSGSSDTFLRMDGPNQRFVAVVDGVTQIVIGDPTIRT